IMPPEQHTPAFVELWRWKVDAKGELCDGVMPATQLRSVTVVGTAKGPNQTIDPGHRVSNSGPCGRGDTKGHRLGPIRISETPEIGGREVQRLLPTYTLPSRVGVPLGAGASHRVEEPLRVID